MTTYFQNTAISLTLKSSICSIHYTKHDIDTFEQGVSGNAGVVEPGVFHFEPEQGVQMPAAMLAELGRYQTDQDVWSRRPKGGSLRYKPQRISEGLIPPLEDDMI